VPPEHRRQPWTQSPQPNGPQGLERSHVGCVQPSVWAQPLRARVRKGPDRCQLGEGKINE